MGNLQYCRCKNEEMVELFELCLLEETNIHENVSLFSIFQRCVSYWAVNLYKGSLEDLFSLWHFLIVHSFCPIFRCTSIRVSQGDLPLHRKKSSTRTARSIIRRFYCSIQKIRKIHSIVIPNNLEFELVCLAT